MPPADDARRTAKKRRQGAGDGDDAEASASAAAPGASSSSSSTAASATATEDPIPAAALAAGGAEDSDDDDDDDEDEDDDEELSDDSERGAKDEAADEDDSSADSEDDAPRNRIGNVPLDWYKDEDHVGYDISGERIIRTLSTSEIDALLESKDNPDAWRTIKDHKNQRQIVLTDTDLEIIRRIRQGAVPSSSTDMTSMVEFDNPDAKIHPLSSAHLPKRRFLPSKWERMKVKKLVALLREGKIRPPPPPEPEVWDLWADDQPQRRKGPPPLPAPKMALPGHAESYNPPTEYLFSEEEKKQWEEQDETERELATIPKKFDALRRVPAYKEFITERFKRCLDLYLVPRALRQKMNVDPESLLPKLPSPKDLRPFPTHVSVSYDGHKGLVRSVSIDASGQWLATVSSDKTLMVWEVSTGRPVRSVKFSDAATAVAWSPRRLLLAVAAEEAVFFVDPGLEPSGSEASGGGGGGSTGSSAGAPAAAAAGGAEGGAADEVSLASLLTLRASVEPAGGAGGEGEDGAEEKTEGAKARAVRWKAVDPQSAIHRGGCRITIATDGEVQQLMWHSKGNYCAAVSPKARAPSNQCIIHAVHQQKSMRPFSKLKGGQAVQSCAFHPTKPHFFVATMRSVRVYDLQKQQPLKQLVSGAKWISSVTVHPSGDHVVVGSYDRRVVWFDLDFGSKPYKTLQYHDKAVRCAAFHPGKFPLLACTSDDASVSILHAKVYSDLMQSPMIVPVKRLRDHAVHQGLGVLWCVWHPTQPWLFTVGADHRVFLWA